MPIRVTQTWTIASGVVMNYAYDFSDITPIRIAFETPQPWDPQPSLVNYGELRFFDTAAHPGPYRFISFLDSSNWDQAVIENHGIISVIAPNAHAITAIGGTSWIPDLWNSGTIEAVAKDGAVTFLSGALGRTLTNTSTGTISAQADLIAIAVHMANGGVLTNDGIIRATTTSAASQGFTDAVYFEFGRGSLYNTGLIEAVNASAFVPSVAIEFSGFMMGPIVNDGVIRGDYAIYEFFSNAAYAAVELTNNGLIEGSVFLNGGDDVFENTGNVVGWVDLGDDNDTFDGALGTLVGDLFGGNGNDTLSTGSDDNAIYGEAGDDILSAGTGTDLLDGGAGSDTASYEDSPSAVTIDLQAGTNAGGDAAGDTFVSIENITGSAFGDVLTGDPNANTLTGLGGNDTLAGGGGDDTLNGGAGVDSLDGGADYDRISFFALNATQGVSADLTTQTIANDGFGNAETMTGIESFGLATSFADNLNGNNQANEFFVGTGDQAYGQGGDDTFWIAGVPLLASGGDGVDTINFAADTGKLVADSNGDGLAEIVAQTHGVVVDIGSGTISDDGFGGSSGAGAFLEFERVVGTKFADTISGDSNANQIHGGDGNDTLSGGGGDDTILGEAGNDTLIGGAGADTLQGGDGADTLRGGAGADTIQGGDGAFDTATYDTSASGVAIDLQNQTATGGDAEGDVLSTIENVTGSAFDDTLYGDGARNVLTGGAGNDFLDGRGEGDTLHGGDGDDFLIGSTGDAANQLNGGDGFDTVSYANSTAPIFVQSPIAVRVGSSVIESLSSIERLIGSSFDDTMHGDGSANSFSGGGGSDIINAGGGSDVLDGDAGDDYLFAGDGTDTLRGGDGNDWLDGGAGADSLDGGAGTDDLARYDDSSAGVSVDLLVLTASGGDATGDTLIGIESISGSGQADQLFGDAGANRLLGNGGAEFIPSSGGADNIQGGAGDDWLDGGAGADIIDGGDGVNDVAAYGASASGVNLDLQANTFSGGDAAGDVLTNVEGVSGSGFADQLFGNASANRLFGQAGNDFIQGRGGNDVIDGGDGDDWLDGGAGGDQIFGGAGIDVVAYGASSAAVTADLQAFTFSGGDATGDTYSGIEGVSGSGFNDTLSGDANANRLFGQGGADILAGRGGNDQLTGGSDNDIFVFADNGGVDTIFDFDDFGDDTIHLSIAGITGFAAVQAVMTQVGADVLIDFATTDIILANTTLASMGADDFAFV
jgi:Ca2+-binding RTX toxin-like protein